MSEEISEPSTNVFADLDLPHHAKALEIVNALSTGPAVRRWVENGDAREVIAAIAAALEEAEMRGKESEAAMWELAKLGQEIDRDDLCHATDVASGETVSAEGPLQTGSGREAKEIWTPTQVANLHAWQRSPMSHPFTCPNRSDHPDVDNDSDMLIPTVRGWICQFCDYTQDWAHDFMLSGRTPQNPFEERASATPSDQHGDKPA
jgi:hypothetical protein